MEKTFETNKYGSVTVRTAMLENNDKTTLSEGVEIKGDDIELIELCYRFDIEELTAEDVEKLIEENL